MEKFGVIFYIDGHNFYHGIKETRDKRLLWLDVPKLCRHLIRRQEKLMRIRYFTATPKDNPGKKNRHKQFFKLMKILDPSIHIINGEFRKKVVSCRGTCGEKFQIYEEKQSDVAIGCYMILDAFERNCKEMYLIGGDGDMIPAINIIQEKFPRIHINVIFPPNRSCYDLEKKANYYDNLSPYTLLKFKVDKNYQYREGGKNKILKMPKQWEEGSEVQYKSLSKLT